MNSVRAAVAADLEALVALDRLCFPRAWSASGWAAELDTASVWVIGDPIQGCVCAPRILDRCELRRIAVTPLVRRSGFGRDLLEHVIEHAREQGCECVELEVAAGNQAALGLYLARGFELVGRRPGYYRQPPDDALLLDLELGSPASQNAG